MKPVDRYLKAVKTFLPKAQQDDVIRELSENIRSQVEDKEAELGRPLNEAEHEAIVKQHGDPVIVASRYHAGHRSLALGWQLVGPELFPLYVKVLRLNMGLAFVACVVISIALKPPLASAAYAILIHQLVQFAIVTAIFVICDLARRRSYHCARQTVQEI